MTEFNTGMPLNVAARVCGLDSVWSWRDSCLEAIVLELRECGARVSPGRSHEKKPVRVTENWQQIILFPVPVPMSASVAVYSLGQWLWHERMSPLQFSRETQWLMACNQCSDKYSRCYICMCSRKILKVAGENIRMNTKTIRIRGHCLKPSTYRKVITAVPLITDYQWLSLTMDHWWDVCIGN